MSPHGHRIPFRQTELRQVCGIIAALHTSVVRGRATRKSIVPAVLIYNTIKTHGKTVDAILVINWGSWQPVRFVHIAFCFNCVFCFTFDCFLFPA